MSYLTQMLGLGVQNFVSAASGMAVMMALIRGFARRESAGLGDFWVDLIRSTVHVLLPLSALLALALVSQGVVQSFDAYREAALLEPVTITAALQGDGATAQSQVFETQTIPLGPVASQVAIKQLGTNGGGFSTRTRRTRSRSNSGLELPRTDRHPAAPGCAVHHVRPYGLATCGKDSRSSAPCWCSSCR